MTLGLPITDEQRLSIDLELPPEAWQTDLEQFDSAEDVEAYLFGLYRLIFWQGYCRGRVDTQAKLEAEVVACGRST